MAASLPPLSWNAADAEIDYPTSDGRPMGETDLHRRIMADTIERLTRHFAGQDVYVSGNILLFYEQGSPRRHVSPDVLVTKSLAAGDREHYLIWREGRAPDVVIEVTSKSTRREDLREKFKLYRDVLRIREYFLYDPRGDYLRPSLQGYCLEGADYVPIQSRDGRLTSVELELTLAAGERELILFDPRRRRRLLTSRESDVRTQTKARRVERIARRKVERLSAELERLSGVSVENRQQSDAFDRMSSKVEWMAAELERVSQELTRVSTENDKLQRRLSERNG